jgi:regulator of protease activity HflC (stomatin/prohibitin superfamily)
MGLILFLGFLLFLLGGIGWSVYQTIEATTGDTVKIKFVPGLVSLVPALILFSLFLGFVTVDAGSVGVVKRFGSPIGVLQPGAHFVRPIGDTVTEVPVQTRIVKTSEPASSKDLQIVNTEVTLGYHVDSQHAMDILVQLNNDAESRVIVPAILESIKAETAGYDVQELVTQRAKVRDGIEARVKARLLPYFIIAESTSITNFAFSQQYEASIEAKQVAEQNAEKAKNDLNRIRVEADQAAAEAKGKADAAIASATGEAQSTLIVAKAKAEAQRLQRENITPELLQLRTIELMHDKWDGVFPTTYLGSGSGSNPASLLIQPPANRPTAKINDGSTSK